MPLYLSRARGNRVTKPERTKPPAIQRSASLPFPSSKRTESLKRAESAFTQVTDGSLNTKSTASTSYTVKDQVQNVISAVRYIRRSMFDPLPERAGMNSVRIAEVLNFQKKLPALVTLAHIHALLPASKTEKEVQSLLSDRSLRRILLVGRGNEVSGLSDLLLATEDYENAVVTSALPQATKHCFIEALRVCKNTLRADTLSREHIDLLITHGFLVMPSMSARQSARTSDSVVSHGLISKSASGSQAAVGGEAAFEVLGGVNGAKRTTSTSTYAEYTLSIPGIGAYVQLVQGSREHLLHLLRQFSVHRQAPLYLLRERWNGNVDSNENAVSVAKRIRGEFSNVMPAKTKKWKAFNGLTFDWILEECLGAGLIELFETGSVGLGVRALA